MSWITILIGAAFVSVALSGFLFVPNNERQRDKSKLLLMPDEACDSSGDKLQMCTYRVVTITFTPSPTPTPKPTKTPSQQNNNEPKERDTDNKKGDGTSKPDGDGGGKSDGGGDKSGGGAQPL